MPIQTNDDRKGKTTTMYEPTLCTANIGPQERRRRLIFGSVVLFISLLMLAVLVFAGWDRWWRLLLFVPFWGGLSGIFQARGKT
jgi:fatty acid desaturase